MCLCSTRYGLDGPGIESQEGEIFRTRAERPSGPHSLLYNGFFPKGEAAGTRLWPPTPSSFGFKERVDL